MVLEVALLLGFGVLVSDMRVAGSIPHRAQRRSEATITEGASLASQSGRLLVLAVWGGLSFVLALKWFRWT